MKEVTNVLQSGKAALFLLIRKMTTDEVMTALQGVSGRILRSLFDETKENALQEALAGIREEQSVAAGSTSV